jgi:hypothetical protein
MKSILAEYVFDLCRLKSVIIDRYHLYAALPISPLLLQLARLPLLAPCLSLRNLRNFPEPYCWSALSVSLEYILHAILRPFRRGVTYRRLLFNSSRRRRRRNTVKTIRVIGRRHASGRRHVQSQPHRECASQMDSLAEISASADAHMFP